MSDRKITKFSNLWYKTGYVLKIASFVVATVLLLLFFNIRLAHQHGNGMHGNGKYQSWFLVSNKSDLSERRTVSPTGKELYRIAYIVYTMVWLS